MEAIKIIALCIAAAILYGIAHDLVTAHICIEYFSEFHPRVIASSSPVALALVWGVLATWWVGLFLGVVIATAAQSGSRPKRRATSLIRPILILFGVCLIFAAIAGAIGYTLGSRGVHLVIGPICANRSADWLTRFQTDLFAHNGSYAAGFLGGIVLAVVVYVRRGQTTNESVVPGNPCE